MALNKIVNIKHTFCVLILLYSRVAKWVRSNGVSVAAKKVLPSSENQFDSLDEELTSNSSSSGDDKAMN